MVFLIGTDNADTLLGGNSNDVLIGKGGDDSLLGDLGTDYLDGGDGNDFLSVDSYDGANDTIKGGSGNDTLQSGSFISAVPVGGYVMTYDSVTGSGTLNGVTFSGIEAFQILGDYFDPDFLLGGTGNDTLIGFDGNNTLNGGTGNDILQGGEDDDLIYGGTGNDSLYGVYGDDLLYGGAGNDSITYFMVDPNDQPTFFGGSGIDTLNLGDFSSGSSITMSYDPFIDSGTITLLGTENSFSSIEAFRIIASNDADSLLGGSGNDTLDGWGGNDSVSGNFGNDSLKGGDGNDNLDGGVGHDLVLGGSGNDTLSGYSGNDTVRGGSGNDFFSENLFGENRNLVINGSVGSDTLSIFSDAPSNLTMIYDATTGSGTITVGQSTITFSGIEAFNTFGTGFADTILGGTGNDNLFGFLGNDSLSGGFGNDFLNGNEGNDILSINGYGRDTVDGEEGNDTLKADYGASSTGISMTYNIATGGGTIIGSGASTTFSSIEVFNISGSLYDDTMLGGIGNDTLDGYARNDSLNGGAGNDYLLGARAATFGVGEIDTLTGGTGPDTFVLASVNGAFYNDGNNTIAGLSDYAIITDFSVSVDNIQLKSGLSYVLGAVPGAVGLSGTGIFIDNDGVAGLSAKDELVGVIKNMAFAPGSITNGTAGFSFV